MKEYKVAYTSNGRTVENYYTSYEAAMSDFRYCVNRCKRVELHEDGELIALHVER